MDLAPDWDPAAEVVSAWQTALEAMTPALTDLEQGYRENRGDLVARGEQQLAQSVELLDQAVNLVDPFLTETGFEC